MATRRFKETAQHVAERIGVMSRAFDRLLKRRGDFCGETPIFKVLRLKTIDTMDARAWRNSWRAIGNTVDSS